MLCRVSVFVLVCFVHVNMELLRLFSVLLEVIWRVVVCVGVVGVVGVAGGDD